GLRPTGRNGATIARSQLLRPYPQFTGVPTFGSTGTSQYDSAQFKLERRFSHGYSVIGTYTWSHFTEQVFRLNVTDPGFEKRLARDDVPHRVTTSILYELPFGRGKTWGRNAAGFTNGLIGGWSINPTPQFPTAPPLHLPPRTPYFH